MAARVRSSLVLFATCVTLVAALSTCAAEPDEEPSDARVVTQQPTAARDLESALNVARKRLASAPPRFYGTYEYRSERETIAYELWVDWPAFRLSFTGELNNGPSQERPPFIIATLDGKRFGVSDPGSDSTYMTRSFGEAPWVLGPVLTFFEQLPPCMYEDILGTEHILGRLAIRVRCLEHTEIPGGFEEWVDHETGLVLRQVLLDPEQEPHWSGFVHLELDRTIERTFFDPAEVTAIEPR
jgi:hypothetical protein